jgi:ABC-2 type transport system ATP-binding protein
MTSNHHDDAIRVRHLTKTYGKDVLALGGISFTVRKGEIFGFLGPNGAGKSTTVKILTTLSYPDSGEASINGIDVLREPERVRRVIGVVAQKSGGDPEATGRENLILQGQVHGLSGRKLNQRVDELLERFALTESGNRLVKTYSGGMSRRLDIAMGLIHEPAVLFLDEPTTGLDPESRASMWADVERLAKNEGVTVFLTTHYLEEADKLADRVAIIDQGRIVVEGEPEQLKRELRGDALRVEVDGNGAVTAAHGVLERLDGLDEIVIEGHALHARVADGQTIMPRVFSALDSADVPVASVTMSRPSLDDVYLKYAGRSFQTAGIEPEEGVS